MKKVFIGLVIVLVIALAGYFYTFHKPHRDIQSEKASVELTSEKLMKAFTDDLTNANAFYVNKVTEISGTISEIDGNLLILEPGIICDMVEGFDTNAYKAGLKVLVKGRVISYDDLMGEVRLDNAAVVD